MVLSFSETSCLWNSFFMMIIIIIINSRVCTKRNFRDSVIHGFYFVVLSPYQSFKRRSKCESKLSGRCGGSGRISSRLASIQWITQLIFSDNYPPADSDLSRGRYCYPTFEQQGPGARFSEVPIVNGPRNLLSFIFKIEVLIVLCRERNLIKLSGNNNKKKVSLFARTGEFIFEFEYFEPEQSPGFSRNGPMVEDFRSDMIFVLVFFCCCCC